MKKIIATVLAMVMALALCATAFADIAWTGYDNKGTKQAEDYSCTAVKATFDKKTGNGTIAHYWVKSATDPVDAYYVDGDVNSYDLKLTAEAKAPMYLKVLGNDQADYKYAYKATEFKAIGEKCGQLDLADGVKGYVATDKDGNTLYFQAAKNGSVNLLVNGEIVAADPATVNPHDWKVNSYDKDNNVDSYKCADCGTIAKYYPTMDALKKAGCNAHIERNGRLYGYTEAAVPGTTTTGNKSPKTFDAGIAMYAGMALMSVAGSAVVIGKKKEF